MVGYSSLGIYVKHPFALIVSKTIRVTKRE
jgi:hypothetical protein